MEFVELPPELFICIFEFLDGFDLISLNRTCKFLHEICTSQIDKKLVLIENHTFGGMYCECKDEDDSVYFSPMETELHKYSNGKLVKIYHLTVKPYRTYNIWNNEFYSSCISADQDIMCFYSKLDHQQQKEITYSIGGLLKKDKDKLIITRSRTTNVFETMFRYWDYRKKEHMKEIRLVGKYEYLQDDIFMFCPSMIYIYLKTHFKEKYIFKYAIIYKDKSIILYSRNTDMPNGYHIVENYVIFDFENRKEIYDFINQKMIITEVIGFGHKILTYNDKFIFTTYGLGKENLVINSKGKIMFTIAKMSIEAVEKNKYLYRFPISRDWILE